MYCLFQGLLLLIQLTKSNAAIQVGARFHQFCELFQSLHMHNICIKYNLQSTNNNYMLFFLFFCPPSNRKLLPLRMHLTDSLKSLQRKVTVMEVSGDVTMAENFCATAVVYGRGFLSRISKENPICDRSFMYIIGSITNRVILMWKEYC